LNLVHILWHLYRAHAIVMTKDLIIQLFFTVVGWFEHETHFDRMAGKVFCHVQQRVGPISVQF